MFFIFRPNTIAPELQIHLPAMDYVFIEITHMDEETISFNLVNNFESDAENPDVNLICYHLVPFLGMRQIKPRLYRRGFI